MSLCYLQLFLSLNQLICLVYRVSLYGSRHRTTTLSGDSFQPFQSFCKLWLAFYFRSFVFTSPWPEGMYVANKSLGLFCSSLIVFTPLAISRCPLLAVRLHLALTCVFSCPSAFWPNSCGFAALGLLSKGVDALCQIILSLGKSATADGKMALTCLRASSDGWLPVSTVDLSAKGPFVGAE